jgi:hypothetical protein
MRAILGDRLAQAEEVALQLRKTSSSDRAR